MEVLSLGDGGLLSGSCSAETARSNEELGALELARLEEPWTGWGNSNSMPSQLGLVSFWRFLGSLQIDEALLGTGVLFREIQTPSTSIPLSIALIPKGISSFSSWTPTGGCCASSTSGF